MDLGIGSQINKDTYIMKNKISLALGIGLLLCPLAISQQAFASTEQQVSQQRATLEKNIQKKGHL